MREHTITVMRQMLSHRDRDELAGLKEKQQHRSRPLTEARLPFFSNNISTKKQAIRAAAREAGITGSADVKALTNELIANPQALFKGSFWQKLGRGMASAVTHGKFDSSYRVPDKGSTLSREASSLERVGGPIATGIYKGGRALQNLEKRLTPWDVNQGSNIAPARKYSRGSAFDPAGNRGDRDKCTAKRIDMAGGKPVFVGYNMGSKEYERCMSGGGAEGVGELKRVLSRRSVASKLPAFVKALGIDPEYYLKRQRADIEHRGRTWGKAAQEFRGR